MTDTDSNTPTDAPTRTPAGHLVLVKPPEASRFNFGGFSLGVLAAAVRDLVRVSILDLTEETPDEAAAQVWAARPDWIGVTVMSLASVAPAAAFLRRLASHPGRREAMLLVGGHGASMTPEVLLEAGADAAVVGEGERTLRELLAEGLRPGMAGVACRVDGRTIQGPSRRLVFPLDELPPPARDLMPVPLDGIHLMETSRGCPHACSFCEATRFYGSRWRAYSVARVAGEVTRLVDEHGAWVIQLADDNFTANPPRVRRICTALEDGPLPLFFMVSARADDLVSDPELLPAMAKARMLRISVGVETLDPGLAAGVGKVIGVETYREVFERMRELGMFSVASFIVGLPGEDAAVRARALDLAVTAAPDAAQFLPFLPLPGVPAASGRMGPDPDAADLEEAHRLTRGFYGHRGVRYRLETAGRGDDLRAWLARDTLAKRSNRSSNRYTSRR